jgi:murein DD-endopeptidase MepM/ murein hydrolase activator NlpD
MPKSTNKTASVLGALPLPHLIILLGILFSLLVISLLWPSKVLQKTESLVIPESVLNNTKMVTVKENDSFSMVAGRADLNSALVFEIINSSSHAKRLLQLYPGQKVLFDFDKFDEFIGLRFQPSLTETLIIRKTPDGFETDFEVKELTTALNFANGVIEDSLFLAANKAGLNDNITMELADILGWDIDFALDIRSGDSFSVLYEDKLLDGKKVKNGNILTAQFINQGRMITAIRYEDSKGNVGYFTPEGLSMRKTFRRNPLDIVRITSRFNLSRKHPVLHKIRAHKGVDYGAGTGTPVRATGDGKIVHARTKGGYGNTVMIQHGQKYTTLYAHLSKYGKGIKEGRYVKQGQVIGYVGRSGLATGPHLHYEFQVNGVHRNPLTVDLPQAQPITKEEKSGFLNQAQLVLGQLEKFQSTSKKP